MLQAWQHPDSAQPGAGLVTRGAGGIWEEVGPVYWRRNIARILSRPEGRGLRLEPRPEDSWTLVGGRGGGCSVTSDPSDCRSRLLSCHSPGGSDSLPPGGKGTAGHLGGGRSWLDIRAFRANWDPWTDQGEDPRTATESAIYTWGSFIIIIFEKD